MKNLKTNKDKISYAVFISHLIILGVTSIVFMLNLVELILCVVNHLTELEDRCIINIIISVVVISLCIWFPKFKQLRKEFLIKKGKKK